MSNKTYLAVFGSGNPSAYSGLSPTFITFQIGPTLPWATLTPPGISEISSGAGIYTFSYNATLPIAFVLDGGSILSATDRYVRGILDPIQAVDQRVGFPGDSIGSTNVDPATLMGYAGRNQEFEEGTATFNKQTGTWVIQTRGGTAFQSRVLANLSGSVTKS
jgi:hypothetical protein